MTDRPFDDIRRLLSDLPPPPGGVFIPPGLGRLGDLAGWIGGWSGRAPQVRRPVVALYAGPADVFGDGQAPSTNPRARLEAVAAGATAASRMAAATGAGLEAFDLAVDRPGHDIRLRAAMSERECAATMAFGMEALAKQPDLLLLGVLGDGANISAGAVAAGLFGGPAVDWSRDPATAEQAVARLRAEAAQHVHGPNCGHHHHHHDHGPEPLDILRELGGREIAAIAGAIVAARTQGVPVLLDGYAALAAAAVLVALDPRAVEHCRAAHVPAEPGAAKLIATLGLEPVLDLSIEEDDGVGALAALAVIKAACEAAG
ncbi:MAG: nicotinate-nucleotide--dimethylbenzimidazole phosphoribosyltransferase [Caulobacterales bacterium]|nr:nicotinate-nucleotide--dimethylbenzimidazole phosphoribosyltransferase [Caulobacterales bacterium]